MLSTQHKALSPFEFEFNQLVSQRKEIANQYVHAYDQKIRIIRQHRPEFVEGDKTNKLLNILSHEIFVESNKFDKMWKYVRDIATKKEPLYINSYSQQRYDPLNEFDHFFATLCNNRLMVKYLMNTSKLYKHFLLFIIQLCKHELLYYSPLGYGTLWSWLMDTLRFFKKKHVSYLMKHELCEGIAMLCVSHTKAYEKNKKRATGLIFQMFNVLPYVVFKYTSNTKWKNFVLSFKIQLNKQFNKSTIANEYSRKYVKYYKDCLCAIAVNQHEYKGELKRFCSPNNKYCGYIQCKKYTKIKKTKLKICGGCRLIYYCCREHQKRDWKFVHSQQCLKSILLFKGI